MSEIWRCFVAVPLGEGLRRTVRELMEGLRANHADLGESWRWTVPEQWHVTLAFLGDTDASRLGRVTDAIHDVMATRPPFSLPTGDLGVFPSPRAARVLWYGVQDADGILATAAGELRDAIGLDPAPLHPHVTLARARHRHGAVADALLENGEVPTGMLAVDRVRLYRSHTGTGPARYEVIAEYPLAAPAARVGTLG